MLVRVLRSQALFCGVMCFLLPASICARKSPQMPSAPSPSSVPNPSGALNGAEMAFLSGSAEIHVKGPKGEPVSQAAVVTLLRAGGQAYDQATAKNGFVKFDSLPRTEFTVQVVAPGYQTASKQFEVTGAGIVSVTVELQALEAEEAAASVGFYALPPKVQKDVGKALEGLRTNKPAGALGHLQAAQRNAPKNAEIEYLFGMYSSKINDEANARAHWLKALELNPRHLSALIEVGQGLLHDSKAEEAMPYLERAVETAPASWRAQALLAQACVMQGRRDDAIAHAQRALELGHERAGIADLVLARVSVEEHKTDQAIQIVEAYLKNHPADKETSAYLERLKNPASGQDTASGLGVEASVSDTLPVPSNWLPPDVDSSVPQVVAGAACSTGDVVDKAGQQLLQLVHDVDRFTATESLIHESINKYGLPSQPEKRRFDYVVSIEEVRNRFLNVEEYRNNKGLPAQFPEGVATNGLPALVLIFHPYNAPNFEMSCEGLARLSTGLAWQVHFKQRADKPNVIKRYRIGADGPSYPVALKGRAWVSADTYQILRLESDLVAPLPEIRLAADRANIEYGPVTFKRGNVTMWLPKSADVYYDWRGRRIHRRHSFSNYMLFAVDDRQKISVPKVDEPTGGGPSGEQKEKP